MNQRWQTLDARMENLIGALDGLYAAGVSDAVALRWRVDAQALRFHLQSPIRPLLLAVLGGTGTGKSTLVNRLLGQEVTAANVRRTFTGGPIAVASAPLPAQWLELPHRPAAPASLPVRGEIGTLSIVHVDHPLLQKLTLLDTPDLDGDQPQHHDQADRVFRWAQAVVFIVTPEKYQMTELIPYYRLVQRYAIATLFVMNKCQEQAVIDDFTLQLTQRGFAGAPVFALPRIDAGFEPPGSRGIDDLRQALLEIPALPDAARQTGLVNRTADLLGRLNDQIVVPLRQQRSEAQKLLASLQTLDAPEPGVDVNPVTRSLQRQMQQRSVLYLMGPGRMLERVRQVPGLVARLPRHVWDVVVRGKTPDISLAPPTSSDGPGEVPDFAAILLEQWTVLLSRIDDNLRSNPAAQRWLAADAAGYSAARFDGALAAKIAQEELADLRDWLQKRWHATPRDTAALTRLLRHLPGGQKLIDWTESAPYLLVLIVVATHHALFGGLDLAVLGSWSLGAWIVEKLSNEVAARTRQANQKIAQRFSELAHRQIESISQWLQRQTPADKTLDTLEKAGNELSDFLGEFV